MSCKCDNPPPARQLEPGTLGQLGGPFGSVDTRQTSASKPQSQKQCISIILRAILAQSKGEFSVPLFAQIPGFHLIEWLGQNCAPVPAFNVRSTSYVSCHRVLGLDFQGSSTLISTQIFSSQIFLIFSAWDELDIAPSL